MHRLVTFTLSAVAVSCATVSCATTPSEDDKKRAQGHYEVALALVHDAQKASEAGDQQTQDLKYREALRELLDGDKLKAPQSEHQYLLGLVYFLGFGRTAEAETHLTSAIALRQSERQEEYPEAENLLGNALLSAGRAKDAVAHFEKARTNLLYATPYFAEVGLGDALLKLGRQDDAAACFHRALVAQPDLCGAYVKLADVEIARGDDVRVQQVLNEFLTRCDSERLRAATGSRLIAPAYLQLGKSRLRTKAFDDAAQAFRTCVERFPGEPAGRECDQQLRSLDGG
jgi:tetratricopeptide (TPR) repeat protein